MTETEWLACEDPGRMLEFLQGRASDRKMRLFACGFCRANWRHLRDRHVKGLVSVSESMAEGDQSEAELKALWFLEYAKRHACGGRQPDCAAIYSWVLSEVCRGLPSSTIVLAESCSFVRDIFGNPFRPVSIDLAWLTSTVVALARGINDERAFDRMPILADALEDAGCDNGDVLAHCRADGPHVRGCWAVDLSLGKT